MASLIVCMVSVDLKLVTLKKKDCRERNWGTVLLTCTIYSLFQGLSIAGAAHTPVTVVLIGQPSISFPLSTPPARLLPSCCRFMNK